ncbi:unnamed protein product [Heterobilharzia americana]|nr:unnamed protein product [Heterobilharzia americana]
MTTKANAILHFLRRQLGALTPELFLTIFKSYVRPHLEVFNTVAPPTLKRDSNLLERIQRTATKSVVGLRGKTYFERLKHLNLFTLGYRRKRGDLIMAYKIAHQADHANKSILPATERSSRGNPFKIAHQRANTTLRSKFFSLRVCALWNALPRHIVIAPSVDSFKRRLDSYVTSHGLPRTYSGSHQPQYPSTPS